MGSQNCLPGGNEAEEERFETSPEASGERLADNCCTPLAPTEAALRPTRKGGKGEPDQAEERRDPYLAVFSHELRSPLDAILEGASVLRDGRLSIESLTRTLATIERNAMGLASLAQDARDESRIVTGGLPIEYQDFELAPVIEDARDAIRAEADAKCIRTALALDPHAGLVSGDPRRLEQVVWKLLSNAVKFTPPGGKINVRLVQQGETMLRLTVRDTGIGFSPDRAPFLFGGFGLRIVKQLVEMHHGSVSGESAGEDRGATFTVFLPRHVCDDAPSASHSTERRPLEGARILLVDDERDTREILSAVLELEGARVMSAASTEEALAFLEKWRPDVLVSDIGMAKSDGYDLIHALRELERQWGTKIPAAALTGYGTAHDSRMALEAGFQVHVPKPVTPSQLVSMVAKLRAQAPLTT